MSEAIERAAAAIGLELGPPDCCGPWTESYRPHVKWPDDYSKSERAKLRSAAAAALMAANVIHQ
jgi:hypothetical protein